MDFPFEVSSLLPIGLLEDINIISPRYDSSYYSLNYDSSFLDQVVGQIHLVILVTWLKWVRLHRLTHFVQIIGIGHQWRHRSITIRLLITMTHPFDPKPMTSSLLMTSWLAAWKKSIQSSETISQLKQPLLL